MITALSIAANRKGSESMKTFICSKCGEEKEVQTQCGTGYATDRAGFKTCYDCCADFDREEMMETGKAVLYLDGIAQLTNWPGTLRLPVRYSRHGEHNIAGSRTDIWFQGPDGKEWHGTQYGNFSQLCHCRRLKG